MADPQSRIASLAAHPLESPSKAPKTCRRHYPRIPMRCEAWLYDTLGRPVVAGVTKDVADGGMQLAVPVGHGIHVGREVRFRMAVPRRHDLGEYIEEVYGRASVVRTQVAVGPTGNALNVGLKFEEPMPLLRTSTVRGSIVAGEPASA